MRKSAGNAGRQGQNRGHIRFRLPSKRENARAAIVRAERDYATTRNPIFAWSAVSEAIDARIPIPAWALSYLARVAARIHQMARPKARQIVRDRNGDIERVHTPRGKHVADAVYRALEFPSGRGARNPFTELEDLARDVSLAAEVLRQMISGWALDYALDNVAKARAVSRSTVARAFRKHRAELEADPSTKNARFVASLKNPPFDR